jgi:hypothetical protein
VAVLPELTKQPQVAQTSVCMLRDFLCEDIAGTDRLKSVLLSAFFKIDSESFRHSVQRAAIYFQDFSSASSTPANGL